MSDRDRGRSQQIYDQFRAAYGIPAKRGCAVIPCGNGGCGCAQRLCRKSADGEPAISPQEEQDRAVGLQHAHRDSGFNEKAFTSCMSAKGYKKNKLYPSVTIADAGSPSLTDTWKKIVQAVSPDNAARQPDSENA